MFIPLVLCLLLIPDVESTAFVNMGITESFAVLAYDSVINAGPSLLSGDIGLTYGSEVSGFPPGQYSGEEFIQDCVSGVALTDLNAAKVDAGGRSLTAPMFNDAEDLGGQTLLPGVYGSASSLYVTGGDLTLDANTDPNAVWIFQIASAFIVANGRVIRMINRGAGAVNTTSLNVWWNIGSSATYEIDCVVIGVTMAYASITVETGATTGALLAANGAVTMSSNTVFAYNASVSAAEASGCPTGPPSLVPSMAPTVSNQPSVVPSRTPTVLPTVSNPPTVIPSRIPTAVPSTSIKPTESPTHTPTVVPSVSISPSKSPSSSSNGKKKDNTDLIVGLVVGLGGFLIIVGALFYFCASSAAHGAAAGGAEMV